jgi:Fur family peroxide stress response transcriptional regulator
MGEIQELDASIIKALRGKGYKATPQRITISRFALRDHHHHHHHHPTVQRIYSEVKKVYHTVSLATVYKTIQLLKEVGLIQELSLPQGQTRFDSDMKPHINLVCLQCGEIEDLEETSILEIIAKVSAAE